jgi:hypothetical protein
MNGCSLPCEAFFSENSAGNVEVAEVVSGYMRLNSDGTYSQSTTLRKTEYDGVTLQPTGQVSTDAVTTSGSWAHSGSAITFTNGVSGQTFTGSVSGNTLIIDSSVYRK